jgi:hypothetical protein
MIRFLFLGQLALTAVGCAATAASAGYVATVLHPVQFDYSIAEGVSGGTQVGLGQFTTGGSRSNALLWQGTAQSAVNLHPEGFQSSAAFGVHETSQVGYGSTGSFNEALLWQGSALSVVSLHPLGYRSSEAWGVFQDTQVGIGDTHAPNSTSHALLWRGTADSVVDLHPDAFADTRAYAVHGDAQVGDGSFVDISGAFHRHALLWRGTAESVVDLSPDYNARALGAWENYQVGSGRGHALLWNGTPESVVDLNPPTFIESFAYDIAGEWQAGYGSAPGIFAHALAWRGSAESAVDLHPFLSGLGYEFTESYAFGVDINGDVVGYARVDSNFGYAVKWSLIPEPHSFAMALMSACLFGVKSRGVRSFARRQHCAHGRRYEFDRGASAVQGVRVACRC